MGDPPRAARAQQDREHRNPLRTPAEQTDATVTEHDDVAALRGLDDDLADGCDDLLFRLQPGLHHRHHRRRRGQVGDQPGTGRGRSFHVLRDVVARQVDAGRQLLEHRALVEQRRAERGGDRLADR